MNKINLTDKAKSLILIESKSWLATKLDMTRPTLDKRLINNDWGELEGKELMKL